MTAEPITEFRGPYQFLSNFWLCTIEMDGKRYPSVEHAYQAAKTNYPAERERIRRARSPGAAKHLGRRVTLRPDWDDRKIKVMRRLVRQKFHVHKDVHKDLRRHLLATGDAELIEGNYWGDRFWGQCPVGVGENWLGRILMEVRAELREVKP